MAGSWLRNDPHVHARQQKAIGDGTCTTVTIPGDVHDGASNPVVDVLGPTRRHGREVEPYARLIHQEHQQQPSKKRNRDPTGATIVAGTFYEHLEILTGARQRRIKEEKK